VGKFVFLLPGAQNQLESWPLTAQLRDRPYRSPFVLGSCALLEVWTFF
jgi:hypothetical protein